jgi:hypothetical protein
VPGAGTEVSGAGNSMDSMEACSASAPPHKQTTKQTTNQTTKQSINEKERARLASSRNAACLGEAASSLRSGQSSSAAPNPRAAWDLALRALFDAGATLPALAAHNFETVLDDLARARAHTGSEARAPVVVLFDNCCASRRDTHVVHTYTCATGDSYSFKVVQVLDPCLPCQACLLSSLKNSSHLRACCRDAATAASIHRQLIRQTAHP